jgi:hypothetical protein
VILITVLLVDLVMMKGRHAANKGAEAWSVLQDASWIKIR